MKKNLFSALSCVMILLTGCRIVDATVSITIETVAMPLSFSALVFDPLPPPNTADNAFSQTRGIKASDLNSIVASAMYNVTAASASNIKITVTSEPYSNYSISNMLITSSGVSGSPFAIPNFQIGDPIPIPAGLDAFIGAYFLKVVDGYADLTISGKTNAPVGTKIHVTIDNTLVFTYSFI